MAYRETQSYLTQISVATDVINKVYFAKTANSRYHLANLTAQNIYVSTVEDFAITDDGVTVIPSGDRCPQLKRGYKVNITGVTKDKQGIQWYGILLYNKIVFVCSKYITL